MAGFGGQGVLLIGTLVAEAALSQGKNTTFMPSYGVEMRGGAANCTVVVSDDEIGSPVIANPMAGIIFAPAAMDKFGPKIKPSGLLIANSDMIPEELIKRDDLDLKYIPFNKTANEAGNSKAGNMVALGVFLEITKMVKIDLIEVAMKKVMAEKYHKFIPSNMEAISRGMELAKS